MEIVLDIDESVPAFVRRWIGADVRLLVDQIKRAVRHGNVVPGDALPSTRQLANDLDLCPQTVAKAYRLLEGERVIRTTVFRGPIVHPDAPAHTDTAAY